MAAINNSFFIPNVEEYFNGLIRLFHQCEEDVNNEGMSEYYCRRLEEYQRTLRVMYARLLEYRPNAIQLIQDIEQLLDIIGLKVEGLGQFYNDNYQRGGEHFYHNSGLSTEIRLGHVGRPRYDVTEEEITVLHDTLGFRWADVSRILGVSYRTLIRRRQDFALPVGLHHNFSELPDEQLDELIIEITAVTPQSGVGLIQGALRSRGHQIQRRRIREALQRLDPVTSALRQSRRIIRRSYNVPGPNSLW